jgi:hypothetical protein
MKLLLVLLASILAASIGCDSGSSSSNKEDSIVEISGKVLRKSAIPQQDGDIGFYDTGKVRIYVTSDTKIMRSRGSCSGFDRVNFSDVQLDDVLFVKYRADDAQWYPAPPAIRASAIEAFSVQCLTYSELPMSTVDDCAPCSFMK